MKRTMTIIRQSKSGWCEVCHHVQCKTECALVASRMASAGPGGSKPKLRSRYLMVLDTYGDSESVAEFAWMARVSFVVLGFMSLLVAHSVSTSVIRFNFDGYVISSIFMFMHIIFSSRVYSTFLRAAEQFTEYD